MLDVPLGQMKYNKQYIRVSTLWQKYGENMVKMDFAIFAIAFNLGKMIKNIRITPKIPSLTRLRDLYRAA
jgi:hypothetical protein